MKTLHLNLKRKWFDMIISGEKKEEYREIKESIVSLLFDWKDSGLTREQFTRACINKEEFIWIYVKHYTKPVTFSNGYAKDRDQFIIAWNSLDIGEGKPEWGAEKGKNYFVLELGELTLIDN